MSWKTAIVATSLMLAGLLVGAIIGAVSMLTTAIVIAAGGYFLGFVTLATAQAITLWLVVIGSVIGALTVVAPMLLE
jgi:hypothetical protein